MTDNKAKFAEKQQRLQAATQLKEPDRVPMAPKGGIFYGTAYGISYYDIMMDVRNVLPGLEKYLLDYDADLVWSPVAYPIGPMEALGTKYIKWPGPTHKIPLSSGFQILDGTYIQEEEFPEFVKDPTHFNLTKLFPRKHTKLKGFEKLYFKNPIEFSQFIDFSVFGDPDVVAALNAAMRCGEEVQKWLTGMGEVGQFIVDKGFVPGPASAQTCPYDMFSDNYRGLIETTMDVVNCPDALEEVLDVITDICIERTISTSLAMGLQYVFIPLHGGVDEFMSPANYQRFYWKGLRAMMMAIIENGMTPYVFCEGNYDTRLEVLADIPAGKVIYMFEKVDMKNVKKILGNTACICGNIPSATLAYGTPQQVETQCKKLLDICAPGGGFMMDVSIDLTGAKPENVEAMFNTTMKYGQY